VNEKYPPDCIEFRLLLPHHLNKFQIDRDDFRRKLDADKQQLFDKCQEPASGACNRATVPGTANGAPKPAGQHEESAAPRHEPTSFSAVAALGNRVSATHAEGQWGDELDKFVVEVQEIADLVLSLANCRLSTMANKIYSRSIRKMKIMNHRPMQVLQIRTMTSR
jgi:hypothetical protein